MRQCAQLFGNTNRMDTISRYTMRSMMAVPMSVAAIVKRTVCVKKTGDELLKLTDGEPGTGTEGTKSHAPILTKVSSQPRGGHRFSHQPSVENMECFLAGRYSDSISDGMKTIVGPG